MKNRSRAIGTLRVTAPVEETDDSRIQGDGPLLVEITGDIDQMAKLMRHGDRRHSDVRPEKRARKAE